ncbi:MAG: tRNA-dihydrouridine synthase family protein [Flavobacteriales bacterium]|jgi:tRNA-dihydrouridine synthase B
MSSKPTLLSSPLQGFTDFRFRNAFHYYFGGIDTFYSPYIRLNGKLVIKGAYERDILPENNSTLNVIPQVMTNDADEFLFVVKFIQQFGYKELNWNLGCPYPMVTKQGMGSGLVKNTEQIRHILQRVHNETDIVVSMKMRMGYDDASEILDTLPMLDEFPIKNIAIHARIGKQLYKGGVDLEGFQRCVDKAKHTLYYNGDITTVDSFRKIRNQFPSIEHFMIGRGLISDPFLPQMIQNDSIEYPENRWQIFKEFHDRIYQEYDEYLSGPTPIKMKMRGFWEFFALSFDNPQKTFKKIKKANNAVQYNQATREIFREVLRK